MISIFEGRIGGGKTYLAVSRILGHLSSGGHVVTNIELNIGPCGSYLANHYGVIMEQDAIKIIGETETDNFHRHLSSGTHECPLLCVIDEAQLWFSSKDSSLTAATKKGLLTFLTQSRKVAVDVVFITQSELNIEAQFRRLASEIYKMRDLSKIVIPVFGLKWPHQDTLVFRLDLASKMVLQRFLLRRTADVYACYNSSALLRPLEFAGVVKKRKRLERVALVKKDPFPRVNFPGWLVFVSALVIGLSVRFLIENG